MKCAYSIVKHPALLQLLAHTTLASIQPVVITEISFLDADCVKKEKKRGIKFLKSNSDFRGAELCISQNNMCCYRQH